MVAGALSKMGYSKQLNQKMLQVGNAHPNRNEQFEYIEDTSKAYISEGVPVISIDSKKKISGILRITEQNTAKRKSHGRCWITTSLSRS